MKALGIALGSLCVVGFLGGSDARAEGFDHTHAKWTTFLKKHVTVTDHESRVGYKDIKADPKPLEEYVQSVTTVKKADFDKFTEPQQIAYFINTYNALTIKLIVDNYPVKSIKDIGGLFGSPWKKKFFTLFDQSENLDWIEHENLRKNYKQPRVHFALVCASKSCPPLRNEAWMADKLDSQFEDAAKTFLTNKDRNHIEGSTKIILSPIFKWFGGDFEKKYGSVLAFVGPRITDDKELQTQIVNKKLELSFTDYDWTLNEKLN